MPSKGRGGRGKGPPKNPGFSSDEKLLKLEARIEELRPKAAQLDRELADLKRQQRQAQEATSEAKAIQSEYAERLKGLEAQAEERILRIQAKRQAELDQELSKVRADALAELKKKQDATQRALDKATETLAAAEREAATTHRKARTEAQKEADAALTAAEANSRARLDEARNQAADILARAEAHAAKLQGEAKAEAARLRTQAQQQLQNALDEGREAAAKRLADRESKLAELEAGLENQRADLDKARLALQADRGAVDTGRAQLESARRRLQAREQELDTDLAELARQREEIADRQARLGPGRVQELEERVAELHSRLDASEARNKTLAERNAELDRELEAVGGDAHALRLAELERLRDECQSLRTRLTQAPDPDFVEGLKREAQHAEVWQKSNNTLRDRIDELERHRIEADHRVQDATLETQQLKLELAKATSSAASLRAEVDALRATDDAARQAAQENERLRLHRDHLQVELDLCQQALADRNQASMESAKERYPKLKEWDVQPPTEVAVLESPQDAPPLDRLAVALRHNMALHREPGEAHGRRYTDHVVRSVLAGMATSRILLLKGFSGTGKTSLPIFLARALGGYAETVSVQSGWRDRMDLLGHHNSFDRRFVASQFTEEVYKANLVPDHPVFIVLDEANLSRVEYYFADLLSELERSRDLHRVKVLPDKLSPEHPRFLHDGRELVVPPNVWFVLTANEDESTFEFADKTFDRASILQLDQVAPEFQARRKPLAPVSFRSLRSRFDEAATKEVLGPAVAGWLDGLQTTLREQFHLGLGNRFPQKAPRFASVYAAAGGKPSDALDELVSRQVLRKLERIRDPRQKTRVQAVHDHLARWPFKGHKATLSNALVQRVLEGLS